MFTKRDDRPTVFVCQNCKKVMYGLPNASMKCDVCNSPLSQMDITKETWETLSEDNKKVFISRFLGEDTNTSQVLEIHNTYTDNSQELEILMQINKNVKHLTDYVYFFYVIGVLSLALSIIGGLFFFLAHAF